MVDASTKQKITSNHYSIFFLNSQKRGGKNENTHAFLLRSEVNNFFYFFHNTNIYIKYTGFYIEDRYLPGTGHRPVGALRQFMI